MIPRPITWIIIILGLMCGVSLVTAAADGAGGRSISIPLQFESNADRAASDEYAFIARTPGAVLSFGRGEVKFSPPGGAAPGITMTFGSAASPAGEGTAEVTNYYLGRDRSRWRVAVPTYPRLRYRGVGAGIDLLFHGVDGALEYDFLVAPGADPAAIRLSFPAGHASLVGGDLQFGSSGIRFHRPELYQEIAGRRMRVTGSFVLRPDGSAGFQVGPYDRTRPLVIDPVVTYATMFFGYARSLTSALAPDGSIVMVGTTDDSLNAQPQTFPSSVGAYQTTLGGADDVFVFKLDPTGTQVVFSTYLGGSGYDDPLGLAVDSSGGIYVSGQTSSTNFPMTSGAYGASCSPAALNCSRGFLTKFDPGGALTYSAIPDVWGTVAVDQQGNAYVAGITTSPNLPLVNPLQPSVPSKSVINGEFTTTAGVVEELNANGSGLVFSTYLAGKNADVPTAVAVDGAANIYVTGTTASPDFPAKNAVQFAGNGGVFLTKFAPAGAALLYSTLVGTGTPSALMVDANGTAFLAGSQSGDPVGLPSGMLQPCYSNCVAGWVRALDSTGTHLIATANLAIAPSALALDPAGNIYVAANLGQFPLLSPVQAGVGGSYLVELNAAGQPVFSTRLGADRVGVDATSIMLRNGTVYVAGIAGGGNGSVDLDFPYDIPAATQPWFTPLICQWGVNMTGCKPFEVPFLMMIGSGTGPQLNVTSLHGVPAVVQNLSSTPLNIQSITAPNLPGAQIGGTCGSQLPAGGKCLLYVSAPQSTTTNPTSVTINSDATPSSQQFSVEYVDTSSPSLLAPYLYYPPNQLLDFGPVRNFESATRTVHLQNAGPIAASATVSAAGALQESDDCSTIPANGQCSITLTFSPSPTSTPAGFGISSSTSIYSFNSNPVVAGVGVNGSLWSSVGQLDFGTQALGASGFPRVVLIQNADNVPISLTGISATGDFSANSSCPASLVPGASCIASVQFVPAAVEAASGKLLINHSGDMSPVVIPLTAAAAIVSDLQIAGPSYIAPEPLGSASPPEPWTVTNVSSHQVTITSVSASGDFSPSGCVGPLSAGASCTGSVTFAPTAFGPRDGTLSLAHDGMGSPELGRLHGFGGAVWPVPERLDFSNQIVGTTGSSQSIALSNTTGQPVAVSSISVSPAEFAMTTDCTTSLPVVGCALHLAFTPQSAGLRQGSVTIITASPAETIVIPLQGVGISTQNPFTDLQMSPSPVDFGTTNAGTRSASSPVPVTISNIGSANLVINSMVTSGDFTVTSNCPAAVPPGGQCTAQVTFHPKGAGLDTGTLLVNANVLNSPRSINLMGTGADFQFTSPAGATSQTVTAGQTATFSLQIGGTAGFSDTVSFRCTQVPVGYGCSVNPTSVQVGTTPVTFTVSVTTPARAGGLTLPWRPAAPPASFLLCSGALALLALCRRRRRVFASAAVSLSIALLVSCGGGGTSSSKTSTQPPVPLNQVITVTATSSAGGSHDIPLFLTVN